MPQNKIRILVIAALLFIIWACSFRAGVPRIDNAVYVGTKTCTEEKCHPKRIEDIVDSRHTEMFKQDSMEKPACELCHGKGSRHVASTKDPELILIYKNMPPKQISEVCLTCHTTGAVDKWFMSAHYQKDVSCNECHLSHGSSDKQLLKSPEPEICYKCHSEKQAEFELASTHKFKDKGFRCLNCHSSHEKNDTMGKHDIRVGACLGCHEDYGAAFEYSHKPVEENCLECHASHGSEYPQLSSTDIKILCKSCHSTEHRLFLLARYFIDAEKMLKADICVPCHKKIHGSKYRFLLNRKPPKIGRPEGFKPPVPGNRGGGESK